MQTIPIVCPKCRIAAAVPESFAGRTVRCKHCKTRTFVPIPDDPDDIVAPPLPTAAPTNGATPTYRGAAPAYQPSPQASPPLPPPGPGFPPIVTNAPRRSRPPNEPWFYWALEAFAVMIVSGGVITFAFTLIVYLASLVGAPAVAEQGKAAATFLGFAVVGIPFLISSFGGMIVSFLVAAPILLGVDVARNIRAMRYGA